MDVCDQCCVNRSSFNCSYPGLEYLSPGKYRGLTANYLSFATETSSPNFIPRAREFEECTGGKISFSEASNIWEDPIRDLAPQEKNGLGIYHAYFMSYSHFPEASYADMAESITRRVELHNTHLKWENIFPKVQEMGRYRRNGTEDLQFLMYDGDFFVPLIRLDLLERDQLPLPNTWEEVMALAERYSNRDLNDDGEPDFGICHFPREGAGYWDWWWAELIYGIWATYSQVQDTKQGFLFDPRTLEPNINGPAFSEAIKHMKTMWQMGADGCISDYFSTGRCAIGFSPPGCWKGVFKNGIARKDENGTVLWQPTMQDGSYAEPYRFKPFGTTKVEVDGILQDCTALLCPFGEIIPERGHHGDNDRAAVLPVSPLAGRLINRAPFFWSGGLGIMIRKTAPEQIKDMMFDFMVYTNSAVTSAKDVASYVSWLDAWRTTQLPEDGQLFREAGWSEAAYREHRNIMIWVLGEKSNGAFNMRLPGAKAYTHLVLATEMRRFFAGLISAAEAVRRVGAGWRQETSSRGLLSQLAIYRSALGLDEMQDIELCQLHRAEMDSKDPAVCLRFEPNSNEVYLFALIVVVSLLVVAAFMSGVAFVVSTANAKRRLLKEKEDALENIVTKGLATIRQLGYPMALIGAKDFMNLTSDELQRCHEGLRDVGLLRVLDTTEEISIFHEMDNVIVFFSYHWPSYDRLGPDDVQRHAMVHSLRLYSEKNGVDLDHVWVWLDIISIPQKHRGIQLLAINSLYVYAYSVDVLIIIAPETVHQQTGQKLGIDSYKNRVWTRVEQVAHLSAHGIDSLYLYTPTGLEVVDKKWLMDVIHVFNGQTSCCARRHEDFDACDRESLVLPLVGLYYRVAAAERRGVDRNEGTSTLYEILENDRSSIFPQTFEYVKVVDGKEVRQKKILFGDLLQRVDKHLQQFDVETLSELIHYQPTVSTPVASMRLAPMSPCSFNGVQSLTMSGLFPKEGLDTMVENAAEAEDSVGCMISITSSSELMEVKM